MILNLNRLLLVILHISLNNHLKTLKMHKCFGVVCVSLIFSAALTETVGFVIASPSQAKEKRGWTLNSAGYLLGPHAIDSHRTINDKHGLAGKRDLLMGDDFRPGAFRLADENVIHTIADFLTYLKLREMETFDSLPSSITDDMNEINEA
ncbi:hypothetical protein MATL_G00142740 [Megalops atlanticus]|uniref:Galanin peptides n=1 Tax=Megalops atlanticus TaxID=7932 RepID=A0A9D3PYA7_MEGAT|nr:hypothetical protein MATL_G00142740 [Megalops atlanticus]